MLRTKPLPDVKLKVASIFRTVDGEVTHKGAWHWTTFVRLGMCNLRCWKSSGFCDAPHTLDMKFPYPELTLEEIYSDIDAKKTARVTFTGGEPLLQRDGLVLLSNELLDLGYITTLETSGSIELGCTTVDAFTSIIMDVKPPSTEMDRQNKIINMKCLRPQDFVKFVIQDRADFTWSLEYLRNAPTVAQVAFGPRWGYLEPVQILKWIEDIGRFDIMLNVQSHKYFWPSCHPDPVETLQQVDFLKQVELEH